MRFCGAIVGCPGVEQPFGKANNRNANNNKMLLDTSAMAVFDFILPSHLKSKLIEDVTR
jgi:hypothetical protein